MKYVSEVSPSTNNFNKKSKLLAYLFISSMAGIISVLENLSDNENHFETLTEILTEASIAFFSLNILFPFLGIVFNKIWRKWDHTFFSEFKYSDLIYAFCFSSLGSSIAIIILSIFTQSFEANDLLYFWMIAFSISIVVISVEFFWDTLAKRQDLERINERLLKSNEQAKYQALINQINPHFLFNSLNVLSYLVYQSPKAADQFIEELSKIYRYILQLNNTFLVPLKREMEFIESYIYLQQIRYQNNLIFEAKLKPSDYEKFLPPLTLEVLIENAIKHNAIGEKTPLKINIYVENNYLFVENNIQPRLENDVNSTKVGLKNLLNKFTILRVEAPIFSTENNLFIAKIPLIEDQV